MPSVLYSLIASRLSAASHLLRAFSPSISRAHATQPTNGHGITPESAEELRGTIANVVFATGIDRRDDLGTPDRFDVYYGMADNRIGVARLDLPEHLPPGAPADGPGTNSGLESCRGEPHRQCQARQKVRKLLRRITAV